MIKKLLALVMMSFSILMLAGCSSVRRIEPVDVPIDEEHFGSFCYWVELHDANQDGLLNVEENKQITIFEMFQWDAETAVANLRYFYFLEKLT